ncbi:MAG: phytoene desaturase [Cyclobacteriaceae bacterium]|nr:phytoene desaturase [Cyclobacteriaceae bacterium]
MKKIAVIGAGFSGLAAAASLAKEGYRVTVLEKNSSPGGRARKFEASGFTFDMGPSWYWMPDVFEKFFAHFNKKTSDYYTLERLSPSYRIYYGKDDYLDVPAGTEAICRFFDELEPGSSKNLIRFLEEGKYKYDIGMGELVYKPGLSLAELMNTRLLTGAFRLHVLQSISKYVRSFFKHPRIIQMLEFPVLFLGATAQNTPALYSLMNYADMALGTWYPQGGMFKVIEGMTGLAQEQGVLFEFNSEVTKLNVADNAVHEVVANGHARSFDYVVASADYHFVEQKLLPQSHRRYSESYWQSRDMAPSSLIFYLGFNKKIDGLLHHTLFFDQDFGLHAREIYNTPKWPTAPQFYVSCPSQTDAAVAPAGHENVFILIPVAPGLEDSEATRERYFRIVMDRLEHLTGQSLTPHMVFKRSYAHKNFIEDYHAFKGNAYGLANTLKQTANLKPGIVNKKVTNLFYTGQLTVPGPGVPPSLISGQVVARELIKQDRHQNDFQI